MDGPEKQGGGSGTKGKTSGYYHGTGHEVPTTVWTLPQMMWQRKHEPEVYGRIRYILFAKDYLRYRMTGSMETDTIDAGGSIIIMLTAFFTQRQNSGGNSFFGITIACRASFPYHGT